MLCECELWYWLSSIHVSCCVQSHQTERTWKTEVNVEKKPKKRRNHNEVIQLKSKARKIILRAVKKIMVEIWNLDQLHLARRRRWCFDSLFLSARTQSVGPLPFSHTQWDPHSSEVSLSAAAAATRILLQLQCPMRTKAVQQRTSEGLVPSVSLLMHTCTVWHSTQSNTHPVWHKTQANTLSGARLPKQKRHWKRPQAGKKVVGGRGAEEADVRVARSQWCLCRTPCQRVGNAWNTIPMFSLTQLIQRNDRGSRFPYWESCHLDIYPNQTNIWPQWAFLPDWYE